VVSLLLLLPPYRPLFLMNFSREATSLYALIFGVLALIPAPRKRKET